jgi:Icc-related predicted phosphoesterase
MPFPKLGRRGAPAAQQTISLYYASDVHGSERCWRKFLGAGRFYEVQALIMGGDLTGKAVVPIARHDDGTWTTYFLGENQTVTSDEELKNLEEAIRFNGMYPWISSPEDVERHRNDAQLRGELFERVMLDELRRWIELADERMTQYGIDVFVMAGNDDPWAVDDVIRAASHVQLCDEQVVRVGPHEMISCSFANPTPWNSPRELDEDALYERLKGLADQVEEPANAIFNLHVPPYDTGLDTANEMNADLTLVYRGGQPNPVPVGSTAVRQIIEEYQPLLAVHGHIHESKGETRIGRTLALNPGSEYNSGHIHGAVVTLGDSTVLRHQFVVG